MASKLWHLSGGAAESDTAGVGSTHKLQHQDGQLGYGTVPSKHALLLIRPLPAKQKPLPF